MSESIQIRSATYNNLSQIVEMLANDPLGKQREQFTTPLLKSYIQAFDAIDKDPNNELIIAQKGNDVVGVLQLTFIPYLTYKGSWRLLVEGVRVDSRFRGSGIGKKLFYYAIDRAKQSKCVMVQLTTDKSRIDTHQFYEGLGFKATHEGMKLLLSY